MGLILVALFALLGLPSRAHASPTHAAPLSIPLEHRPMLFADLYRVEPITVPVLHVPMINAHTHATSPSTAVHTNSTPVQSNTPAPTPAPEPQTVTATPPQTPAPLPSAPVSSPSTSNTPAPAPLPTPTDSFAAAVEADVLAGMNAERAKAGEASLAADTALSNIARAHSADMLAHGYFSHTDTKGCDGACRLSNAGYGWSSMGENIHMMSGYDYDAAATAQKIVADWMASPPHRANILNSTFTRVGVGIATQGSTVYTTADYALPR